MTAAVMAAAQLTLPPQASASHLGSATASAGSVPPPSVTAVQSFQPDLFTGRATTAIPIAVPPGRKGLQPALGLTYSSSGRNGWVGAGWVLDVGYIERSTKNGVPKYDSFDTYTFMFQGVSSDLVSIGSGEYRSKDEGLFLEFLNQGVSGWEVRDKSGTRYFFGRTPASQIEQAGQVFRWALDKVLDTNGNALTITYTKDQNQLYLSRSDYAGHEPTSVAPANYVEFILEDRPDDETSYRSGFAVTTAKRLKEINAYAQVQGQPQLAHKYVLSYTTSQRTSRSLVSGVTRFGTDGATSLPATTFTYQDSGSVGYPNLLNSFQPSPSVAAWNVRKAALDTGHETWGCAQPYMGLPWGSPTQASGGFNLSCVSGSVSGNGDVTMSGCNDTFGHLWTYVYVNSPKTVSLSISNGSDAVGCLYREDASGVTRIEGGSMSLQAGWSILHMTSYHQHQGWGPTALGGGIKNQVDVMNPAQIPLGVPQLAGDANGDAKTDLIKFNPSNGSWTISCATSCTLPPPGTWLSGFGNSSSTPLLGDWNGDGRTDIAIYDSGGWQFAVSTGTSFQTGTLSSISLGSGTPFTGDFNGDLITDIGTYNTGSWSIALGTGNGFNSAGSFSLGWGDGSYEALTGDFNGDGLTDIGIVNKSSGAIEVRLSTGSAWTGATTWLNSFGGANPHTSADFNGDGLTDAAYYNRSAGQVTYASSTGSGFGPPVTLPLTFSLTSSDDNIQVGDFNGDGIVDPAVFNLLSGSSQLALSSLTNGDGSNGTVPDVLRTIHNGLGGVTTIAYQLSSACGCDHESILPFILPVVQQVTTSDGLGRNYTTTYLFHDGLYDGPTKEFRGFEKVTVFDADGNKSITEFHQDAHKKGRPLRTEFFDQHDTLWTKTEQTWTCTEPYAGVHFVKLDQTDGYTYDGDSSFKQTRSRFTYDSYGNVTRTDEDGDVAVSGDERSATATFAYNTSAWILNKPALTQTLSASGGVVAQRRFYYDGASTTAAAPTAGLLTKEEEWRDLPTEQWLATTLTYDAYGNVATVTDALNRTTTNTYDAGGTYLVQIANALGHSRQLAYDPRFGQVTNSTDQNGVATTTEYDVLGRVTKIIGPNDTVALPTIRYEYDLSGVPARTTVHARVQSSQSAELTTYTFSDGLGRTIQTRAPAEDSTKQVVTGAVELNNRGLVAKQWVPYLDASSTSYVPVSLVTGHSSLATVQYTYDPVGRLLTTTDPDGSVSSTSYDDWVVTATDAKGNKTRRTQDAPGRLVKVEELNQSQTYTTTYEYDTLNNLTEVTDHAGHVTQISYDSLGRKLSMNDPDMGPWTYGYDAVDNLTQQTDARGVTINFTYDQLNRVTQKSYTIPPGSTIANPGTVTYTFDDPAKPFSKGKLTSIADGSGASSFEYDNLGRLVKESKTIDGTTYTIQRNYDLLGRLVNLTYPDNDIATYTYNSQGGIETVALESPVSGLTSLVSNVDYNAAGQLTKITYGNGVVTDYSYNPQTLRLSQLTTYNSLLTKLQDFSYTFDAIGNVTAITDHVHTGTQSFQYDPLNRLTQAAGSYGSLSYSYNAIGNMTSKEGIAMTYGEGPAGPHAVTSTSDGWQFAYDTNGNLIKKSTVNSPQTTDFTAQYLSYDAENRLLEVKTAQDETVEVTFQPGWNLFSLPVITDNTAIPAVLPNFGTDFEQVSRYDGGTWAHYVGNSKFDDFTNFEYGVGYQVFCKASSPVTVTISGKLPTQPLSQSLSAGWHLLPAISLQPTAASSVLSGVTYGQVLRYDPTTSALTAATQVEPGQAYFVQVTSASTWTPPLPRDPSTRFVYDGDGGRVKQTTAAGTTRYLGDAYEIAPSGMTTKYAYAGSLRIAAKDSTGALRFYHPDHLGSSNLITNGAGQVVQLLEYSPYGSVTVNQGSVDVAQKFTGQPQDDLGGLIVFPGRVYDPQLGRFLQPDPFVQHPADPQDLNRYAYARNNPVNFVDPSGYGFFRWIARVVGAVIGAVVGFAACGPECAVTGAIWGYSLGDSVGVALESRSEARQPVPVVLPTSSPRGPPRTPLTDSEQFRPSSYSLRGASPVAQLEGGSPENFWEDSQLVDGLLRQAESALRNGNFEEYVQLCREISLLHGTSPGAVLQGRSPLALGVKHSYLVAAKDGRIKAMGFGPIPAMRVAALKMPVPGVVRQETATTLAESTFRVLTTDLAKVSNVWDNMDKIKMPVYDLASPGRNCYGWTNKVLTESGLPPVDSRDVW